MQMSGRSYRKCPKEMTTGCMRTLGGRSYPASRPPLVMGTQSPRLIVAGEQSIFRSPYERMLFYLLGRRGADIPAGYDVVRKTFVTRLREHLHQSRPRLAHQFERPLKANLLQRLAVAG